MELVLALKTLNNIGTITKLFDKKINKTLSKPRLNNENLGLFSHSKSLFKDHLEFILQSHKIDSLLFYSLNQLDFINEIPNKLKINCLSLKDYDEDNILLPESYDLIISFLSLHYSNDVIRSLIQYKNNLKNNGLFLGILLGGHTLIELKNCMIKTDEKSYDKIFPRVIPMIDSNIMPNIIQRTNLYNPIISIEKIKVHYNNLKTLICDIRSLGQINFLKNKCTHFDHKNYFSNVEKTYFKNFSENGKIYATFEFIVIFSSNNKS